MNLGEVVEKLLRKSLEIYSAYSCLKKMNYNSPEYLVQVEELKIFLKAEQELYDSIQDRDLIQELLLALSPKDAINNFKCDLESLANNRDIIRRRVIIRLLDKKQEIEKKNLLRMGLEIKHELKSNGLEELNNPYLRLADLLNLSDALKRDFINSILLLIHSDKSIDRDVKDTTLYNLSFLFGFCEESLLGNNFTIDIPGEWLSNLIIDLAKITEEEANGSREIFGIDVINYFKARIDDPYIELIIRVALMFTLDSDIDKDDCRIISCLEKNEQLKSDTRGG